MGWNLLLLVNLLSVLRLRIRVKLIKKEFNSSPRDKGSGLFQGLGNRKNVYFPIAPFPYRFRSWGTVNWLPRTKSIIWCRLCTLKIPGKLEVETSRPDRSLNRLTFKIRETNHKKNDYDVYDSGLHTFVLAGATCLCKIIDSFLELSASVDWCTGTFKEIPLAVYQNQM